jgi:hypothetical protein
MRQHPRFDKAADIEIKVTELAEPNERADALVLVVGHDDDLALVGAAQRVLADILEAERKGEAGARHHLTTSIDDSRLGQAADRGLSGQRRREILRVNRQRRRRAVEIGRHCERIGADRLLMLAHIGVGDRDRFGDRGAHLVAEPGFDAEAEEQIGEHGDDDRRQHRNQAEQADEAHLQPRAREIAAALRPHLEQALCDNGRQRQ